MSGACAGFHAIEPGDFRPEKSQSDWSRLKSDMAIHSRIYFDGQEILQLENKPFVVELASGSHLESWKLARVWDLNLTPSLTRFVMQAVMSTLAKSPRIRLWSSSRENFETVAIAAMTSRGTAVAIRGTVHAGTVFFWWRG